MPAESIFPAACLIIESAAVSTNEQVESDLLKETHPPTSRDLIAGSIVLKTCSPTRSRSVYAPNALAGPPHFQPACLVCGTQLM
jgi:hypothetical protein